MVFLAWAPFPQDFPCRLLAHLAVLVDLEASALWEAAAVLDPLAHLVEAAAPVAVFLILDLSRAAQV